MKYKKCQRCELNYVAYDVQFCSVCIAEMHGKADDFDDIAYDTCPYCEKHHIKNGDEMCIHCRSKRQKRQTDDDI